MTKTWQKVYFALSVFFLFDDDQVGGKREKWHWFVPRGVYATKRKKSSGTTVFSYERPMSCQNFALLLLVLGPKQKNSNVERRHFCIGKLCFMEYSAFLSDYTKVQAKS